MSNRELALAAAALSALFLPACDSREPASAENSAVAAEPDSLGNAAQSDPAQPDGPADGPDAPVPPPDAVSHPDGYLPPAPAEPGPANANSSGPDSPATEDEYLRNRQAGR